MTEKNPAATRGRLLSAAFQEIHAHGFQAASLERIQRAAGVTRGALYHHFASKADLGYAVVDLLLARNIREWGAALETHLDAIEALRAWVLGPAFGPVHLGCPLNNLAQEMSPIDDGFRVRIQAVFDAWVAAIAETLRRGQRDGSVGRDVDTLAAARFILGAYEGAVSLAKNAQDEAVFAASMRVLGDYLLTLRPPRRPRRRRPSSSS